MRKDGATLCKCHQPVTRHQSKAQNSYGHWYYRCYKGFSPGSCKFFEWEEQPSSPSSSNMASTQPFSSQNPPKTPSRSTANATMPITPSRTPRQEAIISALEMSSEDENTEDFVTAPSPTKKRTTYQAVNSKLTSSMKDPFSNLASTSSSRANNGPSYISRAATDGELISATSSELRTTVSFQHQLLEAKDRQLWAKEKRLEAAKSEIMALKEELEAIKEEYRIREKLGTATTTPSSTTKTVIIQTPEPRTPDLGGATVRPSFSHFGPSTDMDDDRPLQGWN